VKVGEIWAYRERAYTEGWPVVPVELLQFGPGGPPPGRRTPGLCGRGQW